MSKFKNENQELKKLLDLIHQENWVLKEENASKNEINKMLVESQATVTMNQTLSEVKNATIKSFTKRNQNVNP